MRRELEARFGIKAIDIYGLSEIIGPGVACECHRAQAGCTSGRTTSSSRSSIPRPCSRCPPGETGELVITTLTKEALPMIRYRTRDITRLIERAVRLRAHPSCA